LNAQGAKAQSSRLGVEIAKAGRTPEEIVKLLAAIAAQPMPTVDQLLSEAENLKRQKWDYLLSPALLRATYASLNLDLEEALVWLRHVSAT
jgi:ATP-dependent Lhr-like helicase